MKNILKLIILTSILISCKLENITGTGINNRFAGTWIGTIEEDNANYPSVPIPQQIQDNTGETTGTREIVVNINTDGSITIDDNAIPVANIYEDIIEKNNVYQYTISYILFDSEKNSTTMFNYMISPARQDINLLSMKGVHYQLLSCFFSKQLPEV